MLIIVPIEGIIPLLSGFAEIIPTYHIVREPLISIASNRSRQFQPTGLGDISAITGDFSGLAALLPFLGQGQGGGNAVLHGQGQGYGPGLGGLIGPIGENDAVFASVPLGRRNCRPVPRRIGIGNADGPCPARTYRKEGAALRRPKLRFRRSQGRDHLRLFLGRLPAGNRRAAKHGKQKDDMGNGPTHHTTLPGRRRGPRGYSIRKFPPLGWKSRRR